MHVEANLVPEESTILTNLRVVLEQLEGFPRKTPVRLGGDRTIASGRIFLRPLRTNQSAAPRDLKYSAGGAAGSQSTQGSSSGWYPRA